MNPIYTFKLKGAQKYTLTMFAKIDKDARSYPAMSSQSDFPFLLTDSQADKIMLDPAEIVEKLANRKYTS